MSLGFTKAGQALFDEILREMWVSVVIVDRFGVIHWESQRFRNDDSGIVSLTLPDGLEEGFVLMRLWENRRVDVPVFEVEVPIVLTAGGPRSTIQGREGSLWITFGPPPPPPEPSASGSE